MRALLLIMLVFICLSSFFPGIWMMIDGSGSSIGLEKSLLSSTPFRDFFFPGFLMISLICLPSLMTVLLLATSKSRAARLGVLCGTLITLWIIAQLILIPGYLGLSLLYLAIGILILLASLQLTGKKAV